MEYDKALIRRVIHVRKDGSEIEGYVIYLTKGDVIKEDIFAKEVKVFDT